MEEVVLVDKQDNSIGSLEKMEAHKNGVLHRAFSVFLFNNANEMLIQRRAKEKYHSGGLWTNTCCSHPRHNETTEEAAHRRLVEEMGIDCELTEEFSFIYKAELDHGLTEHEYDHVLFGRFNGNPTPNPEEVSDWKYIRIKDLTLDVENQPERYTVWFNIALEQIIERGLI